MSGVVKVHASKMLQIRRIESHRFEDLETRKLMASDLAPEPALPVAPVIPVAHERVTVETQSLDTDGDLSITHKDALLVTHFLTRQAVVLSSGDSTDALIGESEANANLDVNADGIVSPADVLWVVDRIQFYNPLVPCNCSACVQSALGNSCSSVEIDEFRRSIWLIPPLILPKWRFQTRYLWNGMRIQFPQIHCPGDSEKEQLL